MKTKEWQDKWLKFASWPCNSRVERAGRWAHRWGRAPELVLANSMQNTYMHFCYLAACQSSVKAGKACKIGPFGRCDTKQSQKQTFVGHIFACSFCSACVFTLNGSYLLSSTITKVTGQMTWMCLLSMKLKNWEGFGVDCPPSCNAYPATKQMHHWNKPGSAGQRWHWRQPKELDLALFLSQLVLEHSWSLNTHNHWSWKNFASQEVPKLTSGGRPAAILPAFYEWAIRIKETRKV